MIGGACKHATAIEEYGSVSDILRISCVALVLVAILLGLGTMPLEAQELQSQGLGRAYWHVFVAYAIAWVLVFGWIVSVARRLARVEERLKR